MSQDQLLVVYHHGTITHHHPGGSQWSILAPILAEQAHLNKTPQIARVREKRLHDITLFTTSLQGGSSGGMVAILLVDNNWTVVA